MKFICCGLTIWKQSDIDQMEKVFYKDKEHLIIQIYLPLIYLT